MNIARWVRGSVHQLVFISSRATAPLLGRWVFRATARKPPTPSSLLFFRSHGATPLLFWRFVLCCPENRKKEATNFGPFPASVWAEPPVAGAAGHFGRAGGGQLLGAAALAAAGAPDLGAESEFGGVMGGAGFSASKNRTTSSHKAARWTQYGPWFEKVGSWKFIDSSHVFMRQWLR